MPLDVIKSRAEVHKEDPGKSNWGIQGLKEEVQQTGYGVPIGPVGNLEVVQLLANNWRDGV